MLVSYYLANPLSFRVTQTDTNKIAGSYSAQYRQIPTADIYLELYSTVEFVNSLLINEVKFKLNLSTLQYVELVLQEEEFSKCTCILEMNFFLS